MLDIYNPYKIGVEKKRKEKIVASEKWLNHAQQLLVCLVADTSSTLTLIICFPP